VHRRATRKGRLAATAILLGTIIVVLSAAPAGETATAGADVTAVDAVIGDTPFGPKLPSGFTGFSFEYRAVSAYTGRNPNAVNPVLVSLVRALDPGQSPVLRIGGNSTDSTWWPMPGVIPPGGVNYSLTNGWMRTTRALAATLGAKLILGVNLAANRPALAAAESRALVQGVGRRYIQSLEIGNEPDLYGALPWYRDRVGRIVFARSAKYDLPRLIKQFSRWRAAMAGSPIAGPAFSSLTWMPGLPQFLSAERGLAAVTFHRYPLRACTADPTSPAFASIPNLLADTSSAGLAQGIAPYVALAHAHRVPFRLDELNSAACKGRSGVSDTFASALWVLDTLFNVAKVGVDGVNLHTLPGAPYQPFSFTHDAGGWHAFVHPVYYGALLFSRAFPAGAQLLPVSAPGGSLKVWATRTPSGATHVVLINQSPDTPVHVNLQVAGKSDSAAAVSLSAPNLTATRDVTLAGQSFGPSTDSGDLPGRPSGATIDSSLGGSYSLQVAAGSAIMLTL
jgi:hypothetical protein